MLMNTSEEPILHRAFPMPTQTRGSYVLVKSTDRKYTRTHFALKEHPDGASGTTRLNRIPSSVRNQCPKGHSRFLPVVPEVHVDRCSADDGQPFERPCWEQSWGVYLIPPLSVSSLRSVMT